MSYLGSFNGFTFGDKQRPGASVASLRGWRSRAANVPVTDGLVRNAPGVPRHLPASPVLTLNLHGETPEGLDDLIDRVVAAFTPLPEPLPLTIGGWSMWCQVATCDPETLPEWPGPEKTTKCPITFKAADPVLYSEPTTHDITAGTSASFEVANAGVKVPWARRHIEVSLTASGGAVVNPFVHVAHADGSSERITILRTLAAGQTLTIVDGVPRIGSQVVSNYLRSTRDGGTATPVARPWILHPSTGSDGTNEVLVGASSGSFTGTVTTRGTK